MSKTLNWTAPLVAGLLAALLMAAAGFAALDGYAREADFLPYRLAQNVHAGHGLVYNPGDPAPFVTQPLPVLPLALAPASAPEIAAILAALGYGVAAWGAYRLLPRAGMSALETGSILLLALAAWPVWAGWRSPAAWTLALGLLAYDQAERGRLRWAGLIAGLAVLVQSEGIALAAVLGIALLPAARARRYWQTVWIPGAAWIAGSWLAQGSPADRVILGLPPAGDLAWLGALWIALLIAAALLLARRRADARLWVLLLWAAAETGLRLVALGRLGAVESPVVALAAAAGIVAASRSLPTRPRTLALIALAAGELALLILAPPQTAPALAQDLALADALDVPPGATVAHDRGDALAYLLGDRAARVDRLDGRTSPAITDLRQRHAARSLVVMLAPDVLLFDPGDPVFADFSLDGDEARALGYQPPEAAPDGLRAGEVLLRRDSQVSPFAPTQPAPFAFGADFRLARYAFARPRVEPGQPLRVRLDWDLDRVPGKDLDVYLTLLNAAGSPVASIYTRYHADNWRAGRNITYQVLRLPADLAPGELSVYVTIGYDAATLGQTRLAAALVPIPQPPADAPLALGGSLGDLGAARLAGARVTAENGALAVRLTWTVRAPLERDYTVFVHLTRPDDVQPVAQGDGPPANGSYPSHWWQPGELVPDAHRLALAGVPPGEYVIRVGLYTPDAGRLTGDQGDHIVIARVRVEEGGGVRVVE